MIKDQSQLSAVILCGGKSRRFGSEKGLARINGSTLAEQIITILSTLTDDIWISTNRPDLYQSIGRPLVEDVYPGCGPISGIHAALSVTLRKYLIVCACDMPFISPELFCYLYSIRADNDLIIPVTTQKQTNQIQNQPFFEPLHAIYRHSCFSVFDQAIKNNTSKITASFSKLRLRTVCENEWKTIPGVRSNMFRNINTIDDLHDIQAQTDFHRNSPRPGM